MGSGPLSHAVLGLRNAAQESVSAGSGGGVATAPCERMREVANEGAGDKVEKVVLAGGDGGVKDGSGPKKEEEPCNCGYWPEDFAREAESEGEECGVQGREGVEGPIHPENEVVERKVGV